MLFVALALLLPASVFAQAKVGAPLTKPSATSTPAPSVCLARQMVPLEEAHRAPFAAWLRREAPNAGYLVDFACRATTSSILVGLADGTGNGRVSLLDFAQDPVVSRLVLEAQVESPAMIGRPGGHRSLFYVESLPDKGFSLRRYRAVDLATGRSQTLYEGHHDPRDRGCAAASGPMKLTAAAQAKVIEITPRSLYGIEIDHEDIDCPSGKRERRAEVWTAAEPGFVRRAAVPAPQAPKASR